MVSWAEPVNIYNPSYYPSARPILFPGQSASNPLERIKAFHLNKFWLFTKSSQRGDSSLITLSANVNLVL